MKYRFIVFISIFAIQQVIANDLSITVYNQNRGLVKDARELMIAKGVSTVSITDVAAQIDPTSVHFKSLTSPDKTSILEQNYEYDLVGAQKILQKVVDEKIRVVTEDGEVFTGKLLNASGGDVVIQTENGSVQIIKSDAIQHFDFPKLPEGLITRPTLVWMVQNQGPVKQKTEISYLTGGLNWHTEYVAVVNAKDTNLDLSGWVSIDNKSGATYPDAKLKLVAGDVHVVEQDQRIRRSVQVDYMMEKAAAAPQFEEKSFFEYHMYTLQRRATLKDNQIKQISLFPSATTDIKKVYLYDGQRYQEKVRVNVEFKNSEQAGLGMPLPKGKIRVYKEDTDGALEFIGEDEIDHTPKDEEVRVFLGNAFDLVGERTVTESRKISNRSREETIEVKLRNHKDEDVIIRVVEQFRGDWRIVEKTHVPVKQDARKAEFHVKVPAGEEVVMRMKVFLKY
ncbi:DUF4139 domain-containing protein [candidate division KSB1 bacterium]|nr:DUF4139 domain-containing protein [candidate division KSB1 bacterium]